MEVLRRAPRNLLDGCAAARAGAKVDRAAQCGLVKGQARHGGGHKIHRHNVQHGVGIAGHGAPQPARIDLQRPIHHFEAGSNAGARVAHNDAGAQNDARQASQAASAPAPRPRPWSVRRCCDSSGPRRARFRAPGRSARRPRRPCPHRPGCFSLRAAGGEIEHAARALHVDVARFVQRVIETHRGGAVNHAGGLSGKPLPGVGFQAAVGLAHIPGWTSTRSRAAAGTNESARCWPVCPGRSRIRSASLEFGYAIQQFVDQLHAQEAGCAGDKDKFFVVHAFTGLSARTIRRPLNRWPFANWAREMECLIINP